jgi:signal peptidase I
MSVPLLIIGGVLLILGLAVSAGILWAIARLLHIRRTYRRALATSVVAAALGLALTWAALRAGALLVPGHDGAIHQRPAAALLGAFAWTAAGVLIGLAVHVFSVWRFMALSGPRSIGVGALWYVGGMVAAVPTVLVVRQFLVATFIMPSGAMAPALLGYHKWVSCPQCGHVFAVGCSEEAEQQLAVQVVGCTCPNCRFDIRFGGAQSPASEQGDSFMAARTALDRALRSLQRQDLVCIDYPLQALAPARVTAGQTPTQYVERLVGLPGETVGIFYGKLYVLDAGHGPEHNDGPFRPPAMPDQEWMSPEQLGISPAEHLELSQWARDYRKQMFDFMHRDESTKLLEEGKSFHVLRKTPAQVLAMRHLVYDHDHPAADLTGAEYRRWVAAEKSSWTADDVQGFHLDAGAGEFTHWLRYRHVLRDGARDANGKPQPELITDFIGYNTSRTAPGQPRDGPNWVGDLMLECDVVCQEPRGQLVLELCRGVDRFRAQWDIASGICSLKRVHDGKEDELANGLATALRAGGVQHVRFANVDERLIVWVGDSLPFGEGVAYDPPSRRGPTRNDLEPAAIGVKGAAIGVHRLTLWRDTYYTVTPGWTDASVAPGLQPPSEPGELHELLSDSSRWDSFRSLPATTFYVQPGYYFMLGDNSPRSADSRSWGLVPESLVVGRALAIYYPFARMGRLR